MPKNTNIYLATLVNISLLISCSEVHSSDPKFAANASLNELNKTVLYISSEYDFSVVFFKRDDSNEDWYKIFARRGDKWEKIEVREMILDEQQVKTDSGYYISRILQPKNFAVHKKPAPS